MEHYPGNSIEIHAKYNYLESTSKCDFGQFVEATEKA
jgi:hypothetical protein